MTYQEQLTENTTRNEQLTLLYAHYGRAIYVAQVLEQQTIDMIAIDEIIKSKPVFDADYDAIWAKYDVGKKMSGVMTALLQQAYGIDEEDIEELKRLMMIKNDLAVRYFRMNDLSSALEQDYGRMSADFDLFTQQVHAMNDRLNGYRAVYNQNTGVSAEDVLAALATRRDET